MTRIDDTRSQEGVLQPPQGVGPFLWHRCSACQRRGYRKSMLQGKLSAHFQNGLLDPVTYNKVISWHTRISREMWEDFVKTNVDNMKGDHT